MKFSKLMKCYLADECGNDNCNHSEPHDYDMDECETCHCSWINKSVFCKEVN